MNFKNFLIAFVVSLIAFGIIGWIAMDKIVPDNNDKKDVTVQTSGNKDKAEDNKEKNNRTDTEDIKGTSFTALLAYKDTKTNKMDSLLLLRVDKESKSFVLCSLPSNMEIDISNDSGTNVKMLLGDIAYEMGNEYLTDTIYAYTGLNVDYFAYFDDADFKQIIDDLGGIEYNVPMDMQYEANGKMIIDLKKGKQILDGKKALQLVSFKDGSDDADSSRRDEQRKLLAKIMAEFLKPENIISAPPIISGFLKNLETNFTADIFTSNIDLIFSFNKFEVIQEDYPVNLNAMDGTYRPDIKTAVDRFKKFR